MLNIITAFMAFAVLFDTFVVRAFLIPPLMHAIGDVNWWPMRYPVVPEMSGGLDTVKGARDSDLDSDKAVMAASPSACRVGLLRLHLLCYYYLFPVSTSMIQSYNLWCYTSGQYNVPSP